MQSSLPLYHRALDWDAFERENPAPDVWLETVFKWPADRVRELQERRFREIMKVGWSNEFYKRLWGAQGIEPGDIKTLDDIVKLPTFDSDDVKEDQKQYPPYGNIAGIDPNSFAKHHPLKVHSSGGTTGKPRPMLLGVVDWEMIGLTIARGLYLQGARPGDVLQIPSTCALTQFAWCYYKAAHDYLGILPLTTGSGIVTPGRKQMEIAFDMGTNIIASFPEYLTSLAKVSREELGRDVKDLRLKFLPCYLGPDTEGRLRRELEAMFGCPVYDCYGCNELGHAAIEGPDQDGLYLLEDSVYVEILDTDTRKPVGLGQQGNIVATSLFRQIPPIIRFNVRDLGRVVSDKKSSLGSSFRRIDHFLGRSDDMVKIRGTNVYPMGCLNAVKSDDRTTGEWICIAQRNTIDGVIRDDLIVRLEVKRGTATVEGLKEVLEQRLRSDLGLKVIVELVEEGDLQEIANLGREGKPRRLLDQRFKT